MRTHTFSGATSREVLQKVKHALGDDALILSNRAIPGGIEVVALAASDAKPAGALPLPIAALPEPAVHAPALFDFARAYAQDTPVNSGRAGAQDMSFDSGRAYAQDMPLPLAVQPAAAEAANGSIDGILSEIQSLKSMLQLDMATIATVEQKTAAAATSPVLRDLLSAGFSPQIARRLAGVGAPAEENGAIDIVASRLKNALPLAEADEVINRGGIYALVGPTGVGKTTTVAKLAARAVVRFGAAKVALLTTDGYRIGAHDQLRIYGRILSVPVHAIRDSNDLAAVLAELAGRHLILIDTIGMSQRDHMVAEHAAMLSGAGNVKRLLLVQTTANTATLNQVVSAYKHSGVDGCILTKTDEAASLAPALDAIIRHALPIHYVTDGQSVPEDLQLPDADALAMEALQPVPDDDFSLSLDEAALLMQPAGVQQATDVYGRSPIPAMPHARELPPPAAMQPLRHHIPAGVVHG